MIFLTIDDNDPNIVWSDPDKAIELLRSITGTKVYTSLQELVQEVGLSFYAAIEADSDIDVKLTTFDYMEANQYEATWVKNTVDEEINEVDYQ